MTKQTFKRKRPGGSAKKGVPGTRGVPFPGDLVDSMCWCGRSMVRVPIEYVRRCVTIPCKRRGCEGP